MASVGRIPLAGVSLTQAVTAVSVRVGLEVLQVGKVDGHLAVNRCEVCKGGQLQMDRCIDVG